MKVLWFSVTPAGYTPHSNSHNGGGWISSLEQIVKKYLPEINLGVAFDFLGIPTTHKQDGVTYYTIEPETHGIKNILIGDKNKANRKQRFVEIIRDFKPDIIQIFGSENDFGQICSLTDIPVVIHMQGCLPPYHNALFPVGMSQIDFLTVSGIPIFRRIMGLRSNESFAKNAKREIATIQACKHFMGRTAWDEGLVKLFNPNANYYHCEEALRDSFINRGKVWCGPRSGKQTIISVISNPWYKGVDLILKTAKLLKDFSDIDFDWLVYGTKDIRFFENKYKIKAVNVNVRVMGTASKDELVDALCSASVYVHPSYIDNSPNSLCEAQYLGLPVIATFVGGIPSLIENKVDGILVPANGPYDLAIEIKKVLASESLANSLGEAAQKRAVARHNPESIAQTLLNTYNSILLTSQKS